MTNNGQHTGVVYALCDPTTGAERYVGQTHRALRIRLRGHLVAARDGDQRHISNWLRLINLQPAVKILEAPEAPTLKALKLALNESEIYWIAEGKRRGWHLTNLTDGGGGMRGASSRTRAKLRLLRLGTKHTPETIAKLRAANLGKKHTPETRAKMSKQRMGKKPTLESIAKSSATQKGRKFTDEHRAKLKVARAGRVTTPETRARLSAGQLARYQRERDAA